MMRAVIFTGVPTQLVQRLTQSIQASQGYVVWAEETGPDTYQIVIDREQPLPGRERKRGR